MPVETIFGRLLPVRPRDVWADEARDFTPWLLQNSDVLSDLLGMDLVLEAAEHRIGDFSLDLIGRDEASGKRVIVENQLEDSNHTHLGQILTYAAGTEAAAVVWVAAGFRPEHRAAIDWLNERTDEETRFFAVEIQVVRIGDSVPAPAFKLVAQPNDWGKTVRATADAAGRSARAQLYHDFWSQFCTQVKAQHPQWTRATSSQNSWLSMSAGPSAVWTSTFSQQGLGVQLNFVSSDEVLNARRYRELESRRSEVEASFGAPLVWDAMEGNKQAKVSFYTEIASVADEGRWIEWNDWLISSGERLRSAIDAAGGIPTV